MRWPLALIVPAGLERTFDSPESHQMNGQVDGWWDEVLGMLQDRCWLIHARVGYEEGPQVPDPAAPEYAAEVKCHMGWWESIMTVCRRHHHYRRRSPRPAPP